MEACLQHRSDGAPARVPGHLRYLENMPREFLEQLSQQLSGTVPAIPYLSHTMHGVPMQQQPPRHPAVSMPSEVPGALNTFSSSHHFPPLVLDYATMPANSYFSSTALNPQHRQFALAEAITSPPPLSGSSTLPPEGLPKATSFSRVDDSAQDLHSHLLQHVPPYPMLRTGPVYGEYEEPGAIPIVHDAPIAIMGPLLPHQPNNLDHNARRRNTESEEEFMFGDDVSVSTTYIYNSNLVGPTLAHHHNSSVVSLGGVVNGTERSSGECLLPCASATGKPNAEFGSVPIISCSHQNTSSAQSSAQSSSPYASPPQSLPTSRCGSPAPGVQVHQESLIPVVCSDTAPSKGCLSLQDSALIANNLACFAYQQSQNLQAHSNELSLTNAPFINNDNTDDESLQLQSSIVQDSPVLTSNLVSDLSSSQHSCGPLSSLHFSPESCQICLNTSNVVVSCPDNRLSKGTRSATPTGSPSKTKDVKGDSSLKFNESDPRRQVTNVNVSTAVTTTVTTVTAHNSSSSHLSPSRKNVYKSRKSSSNDIKHDKGTLKSSQQKEESYSQSRSNIFSDSSSPGKSKTEQVRPLEESSLICFGMDTAGDPSSCSSQLCFMSHGDSSYSNSISFTSCPHSCNCNYTLQSESASTDTALSMTTSESSCCKCCDCEPDQKLTTDFSPTMRPPSRPTSGNQIGAAPHQPSKKSQRDDSTTRHAKSKGNALPLAANVVRTDNRPRVVESDHLNEVPKISSSSCMQSCTSTDAETKPTAGPHASTTVDNRINLRREDRMNGVVLPPASSEIALPPGHTSVRSTSPVSSTFLPGIMGPDTPLTSQSDPTLNAPEPVSFTDPTSRNSRPMSPYADHSPAPAIVSSSSGSRMCNSPATITQASSSCISSSVTCMAGLTSVAASGSISFGDVNLSSLDLPEQDAVVLISRSSSSDLPMTRSDNNKLPCSVADQSSSHNNDAKFTCQKSDARDGDPNRTPRILTNSRSKPVPKGNNNNHHNSSNNSNNANSFSHNNKYRGSVPNSYEDSNASTYRNVSGLNSRNAKRNFDCTNGVGSNLMNLPPPLKPNVGETPHLPNSNAPVSCNSRSMPNSVAHSCEAEQKPPLLPCPASRNAHPACLTNGIVPPPNSSSGAPDVLPDDATSHYLGRPCFMTAPPHLLARGFQFAPHNFLSTPPPSLPFLSGAPGLLPAPLPPPSKVPPMALSSSPPPLTTSPSKTSTFTTACTTTLTSSSVSSHHQRTPPPQQQRTSPPRGSEQPHPFASIPGVYNNSNNNVSRNNSLHHGHNGGAQALAPYGGPVYMPYGHMGAPQHSYFMGGPRPPHVPHKLPPPPPPPYSAQRHGNGSIGGNSSSSSTCSSHSSNRQHKSRHVNRKSQNNNNNNSGARGGGGYWGHQPEGRGPSNRRAPGPPAGGSTDTSPDSSQYSSPPQTPSPDQDSKTPGKRSEEEPWDRSGFPPTKGTGSLGGVTGGDSTPPMPQMPFMFPPHHGSSARPRYLQYLPYNPSAHLWRYHMPHSRFPAPPHMHQPQPPPHAEKNSRETTPALVHLPQPPAGDSSRHPEGRGPSVSPPGLPNGSVPMPMGSNSYTGHHPGNYPMLVNAAAVMALHNLVPNPHPPAGPSHPAPPINPAQTSAMSNGFPAHAQPPIPPNFSSLPSITAAGNIPPEIFFASYAHSPQHSQYPQPPMLPHLSAQAPLINNLPSAAPHYSASKKPSSCYNCGQLGHRGTECREASIEDMTKRSKVS